MTTAPAVTTHQEFSFTDEDFRALAQLARAQFGLSLAESKKPLVYSRLARRLRARNICRFDDYMSLLDIPDEQDERLQLISALTTNVTSFFREKHHFQTLREIVLPRLASRRRLRIWSAGCSTGQEAYSIAMTLLEALPDAGSRDIRILATDIDPAVVERAKVGSYAVEDIENLSAEMRREWTRASPETTGKSEIAAEVKRMISFGELNLVDPWPFHGPFDAIFCRNVAIYFDQETQQRLWQRFAGMLDDGGYLFIGHSERVSGPALQALETAGVTTYRKKQDTLGVTRT